MLFRHIKRRVFSLFKSSNVDKQETYKRQKGSDRLQTSKCKNSKEQCGISIT